jgi:hypothetical protein
MRNWIIKDMQKLAVLLLGVSVFINLYCNISHYIRMEDMSIMARAKSLIVEYMIQTCSFTKSCLILQLKLP